MFIQKRSSQLTSLNLFKFEKSFTNPFLLLTNRNNLWNYTLSEHSSHQISSQNIFILPFLISQQKDSFPIHLTTFESLAFSTIPVQTTNISFVLVILICHCCTRDPYFSTINFLHNASISTANLQLYLAMSVLFFTLISTTPVHPYPSANKSVSYLPSPFFFIH